MSAEKDEEAPPILREFLIPFQRLTESELYRCIVYLMRNIVGRKQPFPKIFLKRPKHIPGTYYIKEWCKHCKMKTNAKRELSGLLPRKNLFEANNDIDWETWWKFKLEYHINGNLNTWHD